MNSVATLSLSARQGDFGGSKFVLAGKLTDKIFIPSSRSYVNTLLSGFYTFNGQSPAGQTLTTYPQRCFAHP
jgi:hypothetical protein